MIIKMSKVSVIGPHSLLQEIMAYIYEAGVLHIETPPEYVKDTPYIRKLTLSLEQKNEMAELERVLALARRTLNTIKPLYIRVHSGDIPGSIQHDFFKQHSITNKHEEIGTTEAKASIERISISVDNLNQEIKEIEQQLSLYTRYEKILNSLSPLMELIPESPFRDYTGITLYKRESPLPLLEEAIQRVTDGRYEIFKKDVDEELMACVVVYPKEFAPEIKRLFHMENISELRMPADLADMPLMEALRTIMQKKDELPLDMKGLENTLKQLAFEKYDEFIRCFNIIEERLRQMEIFSALYGTKDTFYLCGWIPEKSTHPFIDNIRKRFNDMVIIRILTPARTEIEITPVLLSNPGVIRPFEALTRFLALPKYGTFDPTPLLAMFFPVFFGLILGDMGYGMIIFLVSFFVRWRWRGNETIRDMSSVLMLSSLFTIFFGVIFGELFGDLGRYIGLHHYIDRSVALIPFLIFSIIIGGLHVSLGLLIGVIISFKRREANEAIVRILKMFFVFSIFGAAAAASGLLPGGLLRIMVLLAIGIIAALFFLEKWIAPFDAIKLIVNILSYARIMGFGAASIFLASIANRLTAMPRSIVLGIIIGIFFHIINLVVGVYAPAIQTLRLHYVEFFDKFFYPGGVEYKPFGRGRKVVI